MVRKTGEKRRKLKQIIGKLKRWFLKDF